MTAIPFGPLTETIAEETTCRLAGGRVGTIPL
jgi:hypothetical protein